MFTLPQTLIVLSFELKRMNFKELLEMTPCRMNLVEKLIVFGDFNASIPVHSSDILATSLTGNFCFLSLESMILPLLMLSINYYQNGPTSDSTRVSEILVPFRLYPVAQV